MSVLGWRWILWVCQVDALGFVAVAGILTIGALRLAVAQMLIHFRFHHLLDGAAQQVFQGILDISCALNVVFLEQLLDDGTLAIGHFYFVNLFFLSCHDKRSPMI